MGKVVMSGVVPQLAFKHPETGLKLADITEGSFVKLNENGAQVEFYVAKHNYESGLNGAGRTLLVRKEVHSNRTWGINVNTYASSGLDSWFNGTYKALLDNDVQNAIGSTKFYYTPGNGSTGVATIARSVFALSMTELGSPESVVTAYNVEGSALPVASLLQIAYYNGTATDQWTRTPRTDATSVMFYVAPSGQANGNMNTPASTGYYARPCFTLPAKALFDEKTLLFKGVS